MYKPDIVTQRFKLLTWGRLFKSHCCATKVADRKLEMTLLMLDFIVHIMALQIQFLNLAMEDYMDIFSIYNTIYMECC